MDIRVRLPYDIPDVGREGEMVIIRRREESLRIFRLEELPLETLVPLSVHSRDLHFLELENPDLREVLVYLIRRYLETTPISSGAKSVRVV